MVLVKRLDRLARPMIQESIIADMKRNVFEIASAAEPDLSFGDQPHAHARLYGAFSQYERAMPVQRLRGPHPRIRTNVGRCEGRKRYGVRPGESERIEQLKAVRETGLAVDRIRTALNTSASNRAQANIGTRPASIAS